MIQAPTNAGFLPIQSSFTGQLCFNTDDKCLYVYNGESWVVVAPEMLLQLCEEDENPVI